MNTMGYIRRSATIAYASISGHVVEDISNKFLNQLDHHCFILTRSLNYKQIVFFQLDRAPAEPWRAISLSLVFLVWPFVLHHFLPLILTLRLRCLSTTRTLAMTQRVWSSAMWTPTRWTPPRTPITSTQTRWSCKARPLSLNFFLLFVFLLIWPFALHHFLPLILLSA